MMKKSELKNILRPLIKECVKEVILDDGILSGIISEVARGMGAIQTKQLPAGTPPVDLVTEGINRETFDKQQINKFDNHKKQLMSAIGKDAYNGVNLFEGTSPGLSETNTTQMASPLSTQAAKDPGVDISNLFGLVGEHWNAHMDEVK